jgi:hypothetical protein
MGRLKRPTGALKRHASAVGVLAAAFAGTAISDAASAQTRPRFVAFQSFVSETRAAAPVDYLGKDQARVRDANAFGEMKAYVLDLYRGVQVRHSFAESGHAVDCVPLEQQPGLRGASEADKRSARNPDKAAPAPTIQETRPVPGRTHSLDLTLHAGKRDAYGNDMACPRGTIPMRRVTLQEIVRFPTLADFLHAGKIDDGSLDRRPEQKPGAGAHYYARGFQFVDNLGGDAWLNVWSPTVESGRMSLSQLWVVGAEGADKQTVEAGWQVYPDKWGSSQAALFIYYTADDYKKTGCYNLQCDGFVQVANNVYLGRGFDHYSATGGDQWGFNLQWKRNTDGNWWLFYRGPGDYIAVGYYKSALFANGSLANKAAKIAFGGEDSSVPLALQMGSGEKASGGWQKAAFQNKIFYIDTGTVSQWSNLSAQEIVHDCYTADIHNIFGDWGTYLYFGGPKCDITP